MRMLQFATETERNNEKRRDSSRPLRNSLSLLNSLVFETRALHPETSVVEFWLCGFGFLPRAHGDIAFYQQTHPRAASKRSLRTKGLILSSSIFVERGQPGVPLLASLKDGTPRDRPYYSCISRRFFGRLQKRT